MSVARQTEQRHPREGVRFRSRRVESLPREAQFSSSPRGSNASAAAETNVQETLWEGRGLLTHFASS